MNKLAARAWFVVHGYEFYTADGFEYVSGPSWKVLTVSARPDEEHLSRQRRAAGDALGCYLLGFRGNDNVIYLVKGGD